MSEKYIDINHHISTLYLGNKDRNESNYIYIDFSKWVEEYGVGNAVIYMYRNGELTPYTIDCVLEDNIFVWAITDYDTELEGRGIGQIVYAVGDVIKKSTPFITIVGNENNIYGGHLCR